MKKTVSFVLALIMILSCIPLTALADEYYPRYTGWSGSIVDALNSVGVDSSYSNRERIASANDVGDYHGSADQNLYLLGLLKDGRLVIPGTSTSIATASAKADSYSTGGNYYPKYTGQTGSLVDALNSVGVDSSYSNRERIASANGVDDYHGSADQNLYLLNLLKDGQLKKVGSSSASTSIQVSMLDSAYNSSAVADSDTLSAEHVSDSPEATLVEKEILSGVDNAFTVKSDGTSLRKNSNRLSKAVHKLDAGTVLTVTGSTNNIFGKQWYAVSYKGGTYYIKSDDVKEHDHFYEHLFYEGVEYCICTCGKTIVKTDSIRLLRSESIATTIAPAVGLAAADGPLPIGDLIAAGIIVVELVISSNMDVPTTSDLATIITEDTFLDYLKRSKNECSEYSFRRVARIDKTLKYLDKYCMDQVQAYVYVMVLHGDVYTESEDAALMLAAFHGSAIMERDKDKTSYFYHYHLGTERDIGGHIFFGTNDLGQKPTY